MKKRILSVFLIVAMITLMLPTPAFAEFSDVQGHWGQKEIEKWSEKGIIQGSDNMFRPNAPVTRGEMAVMIDRIMKYQVKAGNSFKDLDQSWYTEAVLKTNTAGIILGSNGNVRPNDNITREEASVILARALRLDASTKATSIFKDSEQISDWAAGYVYALADKGYANGNSSGYFNPKEYITRVEVVKMLDNSIKGLYNKAGEYSDKVVEGNVVINASSVTLNDMEIKGDLIIAEGVGNGNVNLNNVKISGNTVVKGGGVNSIFFNSVTVGGALVVNKVGGDLRIVATGTTSVSVATLESGAILVTRDLVGGGIEEVVIPASLAAGQNIVLQGNFNSVVNNAENAEIQATGTIKSLVLNAKTTVTGKVEVGNVTTAEGADSVINNRPISGGQSNVKISAPAANNDRDKGRGGSGSGSSGGGGGNSGGSDNDDDTLYLVTFDTNGGTVVDAVYVKSGERLTLPAEPTKADADFIGWYTDEELTEEFNRSTPITSNITLYAKWSGWQEPVEIDSRFAAGYPKARVNESLDIELKVKLVGASTENPMEVFMVVNQVNSQIDRIDSEAVIHGHAGNDDYLIYVDESPYISITDENEHVLTTNVHVSGSKSIKVYFVIRDSSETSETPTMLEFTKEITTELDQSAPYIIGAYINSARDKISLHFRDEMNTESLPLFSDFTLDGVSVTSVVYGVEISNNDWLNGSKVDLVLSEPISDITDLTISYDGDALEDNATEPNIVEPIIGRRINTAALSVDNVSVSHNGQYITMYIDKAVYIEEGRDFDVTLKYGSTESTADVLEEGEDYDLNWSLANDGNNMELVFALYDEPELTEGYKYFITFDANALKDFAGDSVPVLNAEGEPNATAESNIIPEVVYDESDNSLILTYPGDSGLEGSSVAVCYYTLTVDSKDYILRGYSFFNAYGKTLSLSQKNFPLDMGAVDWESAELSYLPEIHTGMDIWSRLSFDSGMPYQGFSNVSITVQP